MQLAKARDLDSGRWTVTKTSGVSNGGKTWCVYLNYHAPEYFFTWDEAMTWFYGWSTEIAKGHVSPEEMDNAIYERYDIKA